MLQSEAARLPDNFKGNPVRKNSVDYVLHLGDYLYEYPNGAYGWGQSLGNSSPHTMIRY